MRLIAIGECMVELAPGADGRYALGFAGDTFNTAWYLRRAVPADWQVDYGTAIGDDPLSGKMLAFFDSQGIGTHHVRRIAGAAPGLYLITLDGAERSFSYWRATSAARHLADEGPPLRSALAGAGLAYVSGITLAILAPDARARLMDALAAARDAGTLLAFDPNMRPRLWPDLSTMRDTILRAAAIMDIVLPSFDEESAHCGDIDSAATAQRYLQAGARMVVVKNGPGEIVLRHAAQTVRMQPVPATDLVDTTAAGDSFNAGFLAAYLAGRPFAQCLTEGAALARRVIAARGALVAD